MADEEKNEQNEAPEAAEEQAPEAAEEAAEEKAPEAEAADEAAEEKAPDAEAADEAPAEAAPADAPAGDDDDLDWKARRRLERSRKPSEQRPAQSTEERAAARAEAKKAAKVSRSRYRKTVRSKRKGGEGTPPAERDAVAARTRQGYVVSSKRDKTITVRIDAAQRHPTYEKVVRRTDTIHAHDESNDAGEGDLVRVVETRPLSRTKRWRLVEILERAK